jgi:hypothetical protein
LLLRSARAVDRVLGWLAPRVVQAALNPAGEHKVARFGWTFAPGDKVMQMENDYDKEVYNGDTSAISSTLIPRRAKSCQPSTGGR